MIFILQYILAPVLIFAYIVDFISSVFLSCIFYSILFFPPYLALKSHTLFRWLVPIILISIIGIGTPFYINSLVKNYISELKHNDVDIDRPIEIHGTIAIIKQDFYRENRYAEKSLAVAFKQCAELCQRLLYSDNADYVILANNNEINFKKSRRFYIEKKDKCPEYYHYKKAVLDFVRPKIIDGYCLASDEADVNEANIIYIMEGPDYLSKYSFLSNLISIPVNRHTVIFKENDNKKVIFQNTKTQVYKVMTPLQFFFREGSIKIKQNIPFISLRSKKLDNYYEEMIEKNLGHNDELNRENNK